MLFMYNGNIGNNTHNKIKNITLQYEEQIDTTYNCSSDKLNFNLFCNILTNKYTNTKHCKE